jgi:hypothetical protein
MPLYTASHLRRGDAEVRPALDQIIHEPTDLLSAAYYRGQASRAKELAQAATTLAVRNRLEKVARECDRLAGLVDLATSNILPDEGQTVVDRHLNWRRVAQRERSKDVAGAGRGNGTTATKPAVPRF